MTNPLSISTSLWNRSQNCNIFNLGSLLASRISVHLNAITNLFLYKFITLHVKSYFCLGNTYRVCRQVYQNVMHSLLGFTYLKNKGLDVIKVILNKTRGIKKVTLLQHRWRPKRMNKDAHNTHKWTQLRNRFVMRFWRIYSVRTSVWQYFFALHRNYKLLESMWYIFKQKIRSDKRKF
jgi:hypothetical protein